MFIKDGDTMFIFGEKFEFDFLGIKFSVNDIRLQTLDKPYPIHYHGKNTLEIHFLKDGSGEVVISGVTHKVKKNHFFVVGEFVEHTQIPNPEDPMEKYSIYLSYNQSKCESQALLDLLKAPTWVGSDTQSSLLLFESIKQEAERKEIGYLYVIEQNIKSILINILRNQRFTTDKNNNIIRQADNKRFEIEKIFLNEFNSITLPELALRINSSERDLQRFLKKTYNKTFNDLKLEARMNYASTRLMYTENSVADISLAVGYSTTEHFSYAFKKYFGTTPLAYRKKNKKG